MSEPKPLGERAKRRLRLAAGLMRANGRGIDASRAEFYAVIQTELKKLDPRDADALRALVDWVEDYEVQEQELKDRNGKPRPVPGTAVTGAKA